MNNSDGFFDLIYNLITNNFEIISNDTFNSMFDEYIFGTTYEENSIFLSTDITDDIINESSDIIQNYTHKPILVINNSEILYLNDCNNTQNIENYIKNNNIIFSLLDKDKEINFLCKENKYNIELTSTNLQKVNYNKNITIIDLGRCEEEIKNFYNISKDSILYILKSEHRLQGMNIPIVEYDVFFSFNNINLEKLNLSICENTKIKIYLPFDIKDNDIDKYNPSSSYYNNICTEATSENGTDIILNDRKEEFIDKNMTLCEDNCKFINYDKMNKKVNCSCEVKTFTSMVREIDKKKLFQNFKDIKRITNINVIKCYKIVFKKSIKNNYGFFIFCFIFTLFFICIILFYFKFYQLLIQEVTDIKSALKKQIPRNYENNKTQNKIKRRKGKKKKKKKRKIKKKFNIINNNTIINNESIIKQKSKFIKNNIIMPEYGKDSLSTSKRKMKKLDISENKINIKTIGKDLSLNPNIDIINNNILEYNDFQLNSLTYDDALIYDKRNIYQYYWSLLKRNQILFFSFIPNKDYNSQIIKIFLFFLFFSSHFAINALFFTDKTMHKIYLDKGEFNLNYQIPQIILSSLISGILNAIIKFLSLSEKKIISFKQIKESKIIDIKLKEVINILKIKFILFFIISFIFLLSFWFYITCFCGIYINTQIHLIKDTIISFSLSFLYPFAIYLLPAIFRLSSLKTKCWKKECLYKFSKILEML